MTEYDEARWIRQQLVFGGNPPDGTHILEVTGPTAGTAPPDRRRQRSAHIAACAFDMGGARALVPAIREIYEQKLGSVEVYAGGPALEHITSELSYRELEYRDTAMPDLLVTTPACDRGIENWLTEHYPNTPDLFISDFYRSSRLRLERARANQAAPKYFRDDLCLPPLVCALDRYDKKEIVDNYSDIDVKVATTGSPALDYLAHENTEEVRRQARQDLGLQAGQKLVTFLLGKNDIKHARQVAKQLGMITDPDIRFAMLMHPGDTIGERAYAALYRTLPVLPTKGIANDTVIAASEVVGARRSTGLLTAAARGIAVFNVIDDPSSEFITPQVRTGASIGLRTEQLSQRIPELVEGKSAACRRMATMQAVERPPGNAARKFADLVHTYLEYSGALHKVA